MKKIFSLLMMFLLLGNFAFAQSSIATVQPKLNFQAVVRDADNHLLFNDEMSVQINVNYAGGTYSETHPNVMTNENGLMNLIIGGDDITDVTGSLDDVVWSSATIEAVITYTTDPVTTLDADGNVITSAGEEATITVSAPVTAVPYALQAGPGKLTTDMIVDYVSNATFGTEADKYDALAISDAFLHNPSLKNAIKDTIIEYLKNHKDIAADIFKTYLEETTAEDVQRAYNTLMENAAAMGQIRYLAKEFVKTHKAEAAEVAQYYAEHATIDDITPIYNALKANSDIMNTVKKLVKSHLAEYLHDHYYVSDSLCHGVEICALANTGKPCPGTEFTVGATQVVGNKLQTTITNPNDLSLEVTYEVSYELATVPQNETYVGVKVSQNVLETENVLTVDPSDSNVTNFHGTVTIHAYGCDASTDRIVTFNF